MGGLAVLIALVTAGCAHDRSRVAGYHGSIKDTDPYAAVVPPMPAPQVRRTVERASPKQPTASAVRASESIPAKVATAMPSKPEPSRTEAAIPSSEAPAAAPSTPDSRIVRERTRPVDLAAAAPAATPAPPAPSAPSAQPAMAAATAAAAIAASEQLLNEGRVLAARETLLRAFDAAKPEIVMAFARTFDPLHITRLPNADAKPDLQAAIALYTDAERLGAAGAQDALQRLRSTKPN